MLRILIEMKISTYAKVIEPYTGNLIVTPKEIDEISRE